MRQFFMTSGTINILCLNLLKFQHEKNVYKVSILLAVKQIRRIRTRCILLSPPYKLLLSV